jgi:hypothetical protein
MRATAEVPEAEITRENLTFQGVGGEVTVDNLDTIPPEIRERYNLPKPGEAFHFPSLSFSYDRVAVDLPNGVTSNLRAREVTVTAHEGSPSLGFIKVLLLTVTKVTDSETDVQVMIQYPEPGKATIPIDRSLTVSVLESFDTIDPWKADSSTYTLDVWGDLRSLPRNNWSVDVKLTLNGSVDYRF